MLGPYRVAELVCGLPADLARTVSAFAAARATETCPSGEDLEREEIAFERARRVVAIATGAWNRLVAGNLDLWSVGFGHGHAAVPATAVWDESIILNGHPE